MDPSNPSQLIQPAAKGNRDALIRLLQSHYPLVWRVAHGLSGESAAPAVTKNILQQSLLALPRWRSDLESENWFLHHTVLESRRARTPGEFSPWQSDGSPQVSAFLKAFTALPFQQREVFLLCHGEKLDPRRTAIAMDCSTTAAGNHLNAATLALQRLTGADYDRLLAALIKAYQSAPPPGDLVIQGVARSAVRQVWRKRLVKLFAWIAFAAILVAAWLVYQKFKS